MADVEKVIKGLELCANGEPCIGEKFMKCPFSPRRNAEQNCGVTMARNALALLKEQEAEKSVAVIANITVLAMTNDGKVGEVE